MKLVIPFFLLLLPKLCGAQSLIIPFKQTAPVADGSMNPGEWAGAGRVAVPVTATDSVQVFFFNDGAALYFAFTGRLESANMLFPEVLIDSRMKRGSSWTTEQWWFHVSATDCEHEGGYGVYNNCLATQTGWEGAPNFTPGMPNTDTVEIRIPYSKAGILVAADSIGIAFVVTNTATLFRLWPAAADRNVPNTWSTARLSGAATAIGTIGAVQIRMHTLPGNELIIVQGGEGCLMELMNMNGQTVLKKVLEKSNDQISLTQLSQGIYVAIVRSSTGSILAKQLVVK